MSGRTKGHPTEGQVYEVTVVGPGNKRISSWIAKESFTDLQTFLKKHTISQSIEWKKLASERIDKYGKAGLALRGARVRESLSQKQLAKLTGISQENISRMENGKRAIGLSVAQKLSLALNIDVKLLFSE